MSKKIKKIKWLYKNVGLKAAFNIGIVSLFSKNYKKAVERNTVRYFYSFRYVPESVPSASTITEDDPIWTCWWQGYERMPEIVQVCHSSLLAHAGKHPVHLITLENYMEYVDIPPSILEKVKAGVISYTHFSDILRFSLLSKYGGLWLDATIFVTQMIGEITLPLFSLKQEPMDQSHVSMYRWTSFCLGGVKRAALFVFARDVYLEYWRSCNGVIEYLMIDCIIAAAYDKLPEVKQAIDNIPYNNPQLYVLSHQLNKTFDSKAYQDALKDTGFHKFTWKSNFSKTDEDGSETLYGYLINKYIE